MLIINSLKTFSLLGNTGYDYAVAVIVFFGLILILKIVQLIVLARLQQLAKKTKTDFDDALIEIFKKIKPPFYFFVALFFGIKFLSLPSIGGSAIKALFIIVIAYEVIRALERLLNYFIQKYLAKMAQDGIDETQQQTQSMIRVAQVVIRVSLWLLGITLILANLGINVTSIIASLGIGGIAIALAIQNILGDIFSSFSIYVDKPFSVGDFIIIGTDMGTVEKIGLKTTRIRTLQGEELVVSNKELTSVRVQNFKKMAKRRVVFSLGVIYGTPTQRLEKIPAIIKEIIDQVDLADFDRCHFSSYGDFSLNFETVYYVNSADYNEYMDVNQRINLEVYQRFVKEKIEFAYPTQTVFINKG